MQSLAGAEIKFVSKLAQNRVARKSMKKEEVQLDELSNEKLADYKKKAGEDASKADKEGDIKKGNKRFSGIMKATRKQFDNDAKGEKNEELDLEIAEVLSKDATAGDWIHDFVNSDNPKFAGKSKEKRKQMALAAYYAKQKDEELSPKQKQIDKNKNGKIDGSDLAKLRGEELSAKQKALDKNKNGKIDGSDLAKLRKEETELEEKTDYEVYHKDYSSAVQTAIKQAEKRGYEVDMDDWHDKVATGPKKPSSGKTNSFSIKLMKDGKPSKKALQMQVYNMDNHKYELNMYIEEVQLEESDAYDKDVKQKEPPSDRDTITKRAKLAALAARKKVTEVTEKSVNDLFAEALEKKKGTKGEQTAADNNKSVAKGDKLTGKKEPIEIEPELKDSNNK